MKNWIIFTVWKDTYKMFFNDADGFSWRKLAATYCLYKTVKIFESIIDEKLKIHAGNILLIFAGICIGLILIPELIKVISIIFTKKSPDEKNTDTSNSDQPK